MSGRDGATVAKGRPIVDGYHVDLTALIEAADGIVGTLEAVNVKKVNDIDAAKSSFGHDDLAGTVSDFCDRWQIGVEHLNNDSAQFAGRLVHSANAYAMRDIGNRDRLNRILDGTGPDPGAE
jgi:hypothetical protein